MRIHPVIPLIALTLMNAVYGSVIVYAKIQARHKVCAATCGALNYPYWVLLEDNSCDCYDDFPTMRRDTNE